MFSLINDPWLPIVTFDHQRYKISPLQLCDANLRDLDYPRPDFQGAAYQLLIGLLQTTYSPADLAEWEDRWCDGWDQKTMQQAFIQVEQAMHFGEEKPAFMQDFDSLDASNTPISGLLIDAPGENTLKLNKDHFVKRGNTHCICPHCAAIALYTLQTNAPSGGQGHRTSMRGGGPITTLVMPMDEQTPLWKKLWLNVYPATKQPALNKFVFPWLDKTLTSERANNMVTTETSDYRQAYWGMPRRIEIDFDTLAEGICDLCGNVSSELIQQYRTKNYGIQYASWLHPLSPHRQSLKDSTAPATAVKGQPGGLFYKDWLGLVVASEDKHNQIVPAKIVEQHHAREEVGHCGLWCFGYDLDNMKARCWYEHRLTVLVLSGAQYAEFNDRLNLVSQVAMGSLSLLRSALKFAWSNDKDSRKPIKAKSDLGVVEISFWRETEPYFQQLLIALQTALVEKESVVIPFVNWLNSFSHYLFKLFDRYTFTDPDGKLGLKSILEARNLLEENYKKQSTLKKLKESLGTINEVTMLEAKSYLIKEKSNRLMRLNIENGKVLVDWFSELQKRESHFDHLRFNGRALRAELRAAEPPFSVLSCRGYRILSDAFFKQLKDKTELNQVALALFVSVAIHVKSNNTQHRFASQLAEKVEGGERPYLSLQRFNSLQQAETPEEFCRLLIRAVKLRGAQGVNLLWLADSIFLWMSEWQAKAEHQPADPNPFRHNAIRWAADYVQTN